MQFATMNHVEGPDDASAAAVYDSVLSQAVAADAAGFDVAWFGEHHFGVHRAYLPRPLMMALVVAERTRLRAGAAVSVVPLAHPLALAEDIAVAEVLSRGRIETGLGSGSFAPEFDTFGVPLAERRDRFGEALPVLLAALRGEKVDHTGPHYRIPSVALRPVPQRPPESFLWLGAGSEYSAAVAGRHGLGLMLPRGRPADGYREAVAAYHAARADACQATSGARVAITRCVLIADDGAEARRLAAEPLARFWRRGSHAAPDAPAPTFDELIRQLHFVIGDPDECRCALTTFCEQVDLTHLTIQFSWENLPLDVVLRSIALFGEHVIPALRDR